MGHALLSRGEDLRVPFLGWSMNQLTANQPSLRSTRRGAPTPANLPWPATAQEMTAVTSGSAGRGCLSWACLPPIVLLLVGLGLVGPWSDSWEWILSSKSDRHVLIRSVCPLPVTTAPIQALSPRGSDSERARLASTLIKALLWSSSQEPPDPFHMKAGSAPPWMTNRGLQQTLPDHCSRKKKMLLLPVYGVGPRGPGLWVERPCAERHLQRSWAPWHSSVTRVTLISPTLGGLYYEDWDTMCKEPSRASGMW